MKILIAGGGIGGLTAALCALHFGYEVKVLEGASEAGAFGAGIQLPPNAMKVFEALGLDEALAEIGFCPEAIEARMGKSGRELFYIPLAEAGIQRWKSPYLHIHRSDYIAVLETALRAKSPDALIYGADVVGYRQTAGSVFARLANGTEIEGDVLLGADGIHSAMRTQMLGAQKPVFTGNVAWRATVPLDRLGDDAPRPTACAWLGAGRHCVTYRLRRGAMANFVGVVERDDWQKESWSERGTAEDAQADFIGWHKTIQRILREAKELHRWALFDRAPLATWVDKRVALLGDAAHPMLPFLAQGAAMAVEDAWAVAHSLSKGRPVAESLQAYQALRFRRASSVQARSRANAKTFHKRTRLSQLTTYGAMYLLGRLAPAVIRARQDSLYGYDITAPQH